MKASVGKKKDSAKVVDEITIKVAENKGVTVTVRERYKNDQDRSGGEVFPFSEPKTFVYPSWDEAAGFIGGVVSSGSLAGAAPAAADEPPMAPPTGTMGELTTDEIDDGMAKAGMVMGSEQPDTYKSMRSGMR
jgi:hypothetical protein